MSNRYYKEFNPSPVIRTYPATQVRMLDIYSSWSPTVIDEEYIRKVDLPIPDTWVLLKGVIYEAPNLQERESYAKY